MVATAIPNTFTVVQEGLENGAYWVYLECRDYDHYASLPSGLQYKGFTLGKAGWSSDTHRVAYSTTIKLARGL